jgi:ribosomal protein S1
MAEELTENIAETTAEAAPPTPEIPEPTTIADLKPKMKITGKVTRLELYGAFIDLGVGVSAILHISKMGEKVNRISDALNVGDEVSVWVESVDPARSQVTVTMLEPLAVEWSDLQEGQVYTGKVTRLEKFGAFIDIGAEKEGLIHVSELSHDYVKHPSEVVKVDDEVEVKILGFNRRKRRIDLSRKALQESPQAQAQAAIEIYEELEPEEEEDMPTAMEIAIRQAMGQRPGGRAGGKAGKKARQREKVRSAQDDLLSRTLRVGQEAIKE